MPGRLNVKASAGRVYPPDWSLIGYDDTPISTLIGFDYAVSIKDNWDTSIVTHTERFRDDKVLMYFPKNIDTTNIQTADRMFQASDLEYIDIDLSSARTATAVFTDCSNLRGAVIHGLGNPDAPAGTLNNIANMFSNCRSLVDVDLNLTEYSTPLSAVNLFTDCWELKEFEYDGTSESIARIVTLYNAFTNCYKLESLTVKDDLTEWIGCYAAGSQTNNGCFFDIDIGRTAPNGAQGAFRKAKIAPGSTFLLRNFSNAQDIFREAVIKGSPAYVTFGPSFPSSPALNCSYAFADATCELNNVGISIPSISNANHMFDGFTFSTSEGRITTEYFNINSAANLQNMFSNSNVKTIAGLGQKSITAATTLSNMFYNSLNLDNNTLDDIMSLLTTATSYTGTKTLQAVGFTESDVYPQSRFQNLSNWNAFIADGWSYS